MLRNAGAGVLSVLLGPTLLAACGGESDAGAEGAGPLRWGDSTDGSTGSIFPYLIEKLDLGAKYDFDLQVQRLAPADQTQAVLNDLVDTVTTGPTPTVAANQQGGTIRLFGPAFLSPISLVARADSDIETLADIAGSTLATQDPVTSTYQVTAMVLFLNGVNMERDVKVLVGDPPAAQAFFDRGDAEIIAMTEPTISKLLAAGHREIAHTNDLWREETGNDLVFTARTAKAEWLEANPEVAQQAFEMQVELNDYVRGHPEVFDEFPEALGLTPDDTEVLELVKERMPRLFASDWGDPVFEDFDRQVELAVERGFLDAPPDQVPWIEV